MAVLEGESMAAKRNTTVSIKLDTPVEVSGTSTDHIQMREPTVADQLAAEKYQGGDAEREIMMLANLCQMAPEDLHHMTMRDYRKLQQAFSNFLD